MNNTQTFDFELVSPEKKLISAPATMVVIPGTEGDFGVLPNHMKLVASIRPGVVRVSMEGDETENIFIAGGFADVTGESCTVLAEEAVNVNDLSHNDLEQTIRNLNEDLSLTEGEQDKTRITKKLALAKAKLEAITGKVVL